SNLSAQFISDVVTGGTAAGSSETKGPTFTSNYLNYGVTSGYNITHELTATGSINRQVQGQPGFPVTSSTIMSTGISWTHRVLGGSFGAHYGISYYFSPVHLNANDQNTTKDSTSTGHNAAVSYGRNLFGFATSGSFSYGHSLTTLLIGYMQDNY